jgi:glyoxylase-like metal-dependent hydrolase (beta-lactamase superfamily II)
MFGIIPRPLWVRHFPPDERGRIQLDTNCILVRAGSELVLVDTGNGPKMSEKEREIFDLAPGEELLANLAAVGVHAADVTLVLFSHLHMDHVGGATRFDAGGGIVPAFPRARFVAQRVEWEDALANRSHMRTSYRPENLEPLARSGRLELIEGNRELVPGIRVEVTGGHTRAHQCVFLESAGETAVFLGDLCPTPAHFRGPYNMAFDMEPYVTMCAKAELLERASAGDWLLLFDHEPVRKAVPART